MMRVASLPRPQSRVCEWCFSRCVDMRDKGYEAFVRDYTQTFLNAEVRDGEQLFAQPMTVGSRDIFWTGDVLCGRCEKHCQACGASPRGWQEHFSRRMSGTHVCSLTWSVISAQVCMWTTCWLWVQKMQRCNCHRISRRIWKCVGAW